VWALPLFLARKRNLLLINVKTKILRTSGYLFALLLAILYPITGALQAQESRSTIYGYVEDAFTGEKLIGASVVATVTPEITGATTTNAYGFFTLTVTGRIRSATVSFTGYATLVLTDSLQTGQTMSVKLIPAAKTETSVMVTANKAAGIQTAQLGKMTMPVNMIKQMPRFLGENDVLKALQTLPGITQGMEGTSGLIVRGGSPDQTLFLLDGTPVYNPAHLGGIFSPFNGDAIKNVDIYKGGFPARFGERLSAVIDMSTKDGNMKTFKGEGAVGMIASKVLFEGPLIKDRTSFLISARRSYLDVLANPLIALSNTTEERRKLGMYFYDINAKLNHILSAKDRLYGSLFYSRDHFRLRNDYTYQQGNYTERNTAKIAWANLIGTLRWNHLFNARLFSNTTVNLTNYRFGSGFDNNALDNNVRIITKADYTSYIKDYGAKIDFDYRPSFYHSLKAGLAGSYKVFIPGTAANKYTSDGETLINSVSTNGKQYSPELMAYAEDQWRISNQWNVNMGLHASIFRASRRWYSSLEPRFTFNYEPLPVLRFSASYVQMRQYIHLLANNSVSLPTDLWVPSTDKIKPMLSRQFSLGTAASLWRGKYGLSIEGYYKTLDGTIEYKEGESYFTSSVKNWEDKVESGSGTAYGSELLLQKKQGKTTGWVGYTLSWSNRKFPTINFGGEFPYKYDRRHAINVVLMHRLSERWRFSANWQFQSGSPYTFATSKYEMIEGPEGGNSYYTKSIEYINGRNQYRLLDYHRLDLGFTWSKKKKGFEKSWDFSFYNVYNRKNPLFYSYESKNDFGTMYGNKVLKGSTIFTFLPSISYGFKF